MKFLLNRFWLNFFRKISRFSHFNTCFFFLNPNKAWVCSSWYLLFFNSAQFVSHVLKHTQTFNSIVGSHQNVFFRILYGNILKISTPVSLGAKTFSLSGCINSSLCGPATWLICMLHSSKSTSILSTTVLSQFFLFLCPACSFENYGQIWRAIFSYSIHARLRLLSLGTGYDVCGMFAIETFPQFLHTGGFFWGGGHPLSLWLYQTFFKHHNKLWCNNSFFIR